MKFGPAEMSQMMDGAMSWITVMAVSSVGIGIILGLIVVVLYRNELVIGTTSSLLPSIYSFVVLVALVGGGILYYYSLRHSDSPADHQQVSARPSPPTNEPQQQVPSDFEATYKQLGIPSLPRGIERQQQIQNRLSQLSREACYIDAIEGLGRALLDAGYPREAATSLRNFVRRCGSAAEVLPLAHTALERISDFSGTLEVANELVDAAPANGTFRYWRAMAYERTGRFSQAVVDYMNTIQLIGDPKTIFGDVFYKWSKSYAALGRYCDAITPIEMYRAGLKNLHRAISGVSA
jgi:tetratricopeptide (TPR) repeat protein